MSLPSRTIDAIFTRMLVRYGAAWLRVWDDVPMDAVKADWASELSGLSAESVRHALDNLPADRPPTVGQFRALCINRPVIFEQKQLPAPAADKERVRSMLAKARAAITGGRA